MAVPPPPRSRNLKKNSQLRMPGLFTSKKLPEKEQRTLVGWGRNALATCGSGLLYTLGSDDWFLPHRSFSAIRLICAEIDRGKQKTWKWVSKQRAELPLDLIGTHRRKKGIPPTAEKAMQVLCCEERSGGPPAPQENRARMLGDACKLLGAVSAGANHVGHAGPSAGPASRGSVVQGRRRGGLFECTIGLGPFGTVGVPPQPVVRFGRVPVEAVDVLAVDGERGVGCPLPPPGPEGNPNSARLLAK